MQWFLKFYGMNSNSLSKDIILKHTNCNDIYTKFLGLNDFPKSNISSPFSDDKKPSFKVYSNGSFKCNSSTKQGDIWQFVAYLKNLDVKKQFKEVLKIIATEMNIEYLINADVSSTVKKKTLQQNRNTIATNLINDYSITEVKPKVTVPDLNIETTTIAIPLQQNNNNVAINVATKNETIAIEPGLKKLSVAIRDFTTLDLEYWNKLGVDKTILENYKVHSISANGFNESKLYPTKENSIAFAYEVKGLFKMYVPEQPKLNIKKTLIPHLKNMIFGLEQLPTEKIENLIICEGEKDTIVGASRGFNMITLGSATNRPLKNQIELLQSRCKNLFVCFDDDIDINNTQNSGQDAQKEIVKIYPKIIPLILPNKKNIKGHDITDYFQEHSAQDFQKIIDLAVKNKNVVEVVQDKKHYIYELPKEVKQPIEKYIEDIEKYGLFMANNQIWTIQGDKKFYFKSISNFEISILYHIQDEKKPIKILKTKNIANDEKVFSVIANGINTRSKLSNELNLVGNYIFSGTEREFDKLNRFLNDKMGVASQIEVLGWQKTLKFWVWNNRINLTNGKFLKIDEYGCFRFDNKNFYLPSANKLALENDFKYQEQKKFIYLESKISAFELFKKTIDVHDGHGISAILFSIASLFNDYIFDKTKGFPLLFLYGQASSGKTQLAYFCQSFLGNYQTPLNISNGVSTKVAGIREFAQFSNGISHLAEYKPNIGDTDSKVTGIYDKNGYKRGVIDSNVGTDSVPILSSGLITGNYFPSDEPLISRLIWLEMQGKEQNEISKQKYYDLGEIIDNGISSISDELIQKRQDFELTWHNHYKNCSNILQNRITTYYPRQIQNLSILLATFKVFESNNIFPFTEIEIIEHFKISTNKQNGKLKANNILFKWWDCFLICFKSFESNKITKNVDFKIEGDELFFNFNNINQKVSRQWYSQYKENCPSISIISEAIKRESYYFASKDKRIRTGGSGTSVFGIKLSGLSIKSDFMDYYQYTESPVTS